MNIRGCDLRFVVCDTLVSRVVVAEAAWLFRPIFRSYPKTLGITRPRNYTLFQ